jgi:predicted transposase YbfD/YdcC
LATQASLVLGQEACAEKSNERTAIPILLETLRLKGVIVTIDAMGTHPNIAQSIRDKEADYILAVKDNQPLLADSIKTFFEIGQQEGWKHCTHSFEESVEKDHGRIEVRRCWAFEQIECLSRPDQWPDLKMFGVIEAERTTGGKTPVERRYFYFIRLRKSLMRTPYDIIQSVVYKRVVYYYVN